MLTQVLVFFQVNYATGKPGPKVKLHHYTNQMPSSHTYTGKQIKVAGVIDICIEYHGQNINASVMIVKGHKVNLFGRDLLKNIYLNWNEICHVKKTIFLSFKP